MTAAPGDVDSDAVGGRHHRAGVDAHGTRLHGRPVVHAVHRLHRETIKQAVFNHYARAGKAFLTGLKYQHGCAVKLPACRQVTGRTHQHRGVPIVAAAVHQASFGGLPGKLVVLGHGQCVHVGAQACHPAAGVLPTADDRYQTGLADASVHLIHTATLKCLLDARSRVNLFKTKLGVRMQVAAKGCELGVKLADLRKSAALGLE